jgi:class 3 adenylate cyclase
MTLAMRERVVELRAKWQKLGYDLGFGVGIAQGYATIGAIGFEGRWEYGAIGSVPNLAARLCGEAKPGEILIAQRLLANVGRMRGSGRANAKRFSSSGVGLSSDGIKGGKGLGVKGEWFGKRSRARDAKDAK